jgi:uncharacterized membrane protein
MRMTGPGRLLFALSLAVLGAFTIGFPGFAPAWPLVPKGIVWHDALVNLSGAILLAGGIGLLVPRTAKPSSLVLAGFLLLQLLLQIPHVAAHPLVEVMWEQTSENLIYVAGAWTIFSMLPRDGGAFANLGNVRAGQMLFALALPAIGLSHMLYLDQTAPLIPSWLPFHVPLAYLTGAAHIAAGAGILFGVLPRLAATLEAVMVSLFTLLVWIPIVTAPSPSRFDWAEICVSTVISGSAWAVAESFRGRSWKSVRRG